MKAARKLEIETLHFGFSLPADAIVRLFFRTSPPQGSRINIRGKVVARPYFPLTPIDFVRLS